MSRVFPSRWITVSAVAFVAGLLSAPSAMAQEEIEIAEELIVDLDAAHATAGEDIWENQGALEDFQRIGNPLVEEIQGAMAVTFNSSNEQDAYQSLEPAPDGIAGFDPTRTIEVWAFNPEIADEETLLAWGHRGGPCGSNMSFNYGTNAYFGAIGHWCHDPGPDIGWFHDPDGGYVAGAPEAGRWHHLVYTFDGDETDEGDPTYTTRVYADGCQIGEFCNEETIGQGLINTHPGPIVLAAQLEGDGISLNFALRGTLSLGRVRIHDGVLSADQILANYEAEKEDFPNPDVAPEFVVVPREDEYLAGRPTYTARVSAEGFPDPVVEAVAPPGATVSADGVYSYTLPDPQPASFVATVRASNAVGTVDASWTVTRRELPPEGEIAIAGQLLVHLDAEGSGGEELWVNLAEDSPVGDFLKIGNPFFEIIEGDVDAPAVTFNAEFMEDAYQSMENAPEGLIGRDATRTIEVWAFNPEIADEETLVAWARRGGPCGTNMSFNYGINAYFGAIGHWCHDPGPDIGWFHDPNGGYLAGAPEAGRWHYLVYTYDGDTTRVYADGVLSNSEFLGAGTINTHSGTPIVIASQIEPDGVALNVPLRGSLSLSRVRVHDGVLTPEQIVHNYNTEFSSFGLVTAPAFENVPTEDEINTGTAVYARSVTTSGSPVPVVAVLAPEGATIDAEGLVSYVIPDPEPDSFDVVLRATNAGGSVDASWTVTIVRGSPLSVPPVHRYSFTDSADDSIGGAHGTVVGDVTFEAGRAVLNGNNGRSSDGNPPGAYIDLPNGIISALGEQATFEVWATWDGSSSSSWQRIFDFGNSNGGEDSAPGAAGQYYIFLTPRSGNNTLRFGYRNGPFDVERNLNAPRMEIRPEKHIVIVWDGDTTTARMFVNGELVDEDSAVHFSLVEMDDINNWLGRSNWNDPMYRGSYNEFRIYDYPLERAEVLGNFQAGPDRLTSEEVGASLRPGDVTYDGTLNLSDPILALGFLFSGDSIAECYATNVGGDVKLTEAGWKVLDWTGDGKHNITDAVSSLEFQFAGGSSHFLGEGCTQIEGTCEDKCR